MNDENEHVRVLVHLTEYRERRRRGLPPVSVLPAVPPCQAVGPCRMRLLCRSWNQCLLGSHVLSPRSA
ncbi:hypothetical protein J2S43_001973 [Catenuloplanes nepalensis]|uniref:Uncharacterized protein n=1 Tax=Catenuloplanes nepalensis TaxID=587533 RepID=A0ABT9MR01_9ACTN|nr:hypothetical protein [Catenuloplanes nepalensis]